MLASLIISNNPQHFPSEERPNHYFYVVIINRNMSKASLRRSARAPKKLAVSEYSAGDLVQVGRSHLCCWITDHDVCRAAGVWTSHPRAVGEGVCDHTWTLLWYSTTAEESRMPNMSLFSHWPVCSLTTHRSPRRNRRSSSRTRRCATAPRSVPASRSS